MQRARTRVIAAERGTPLALLVVGAIGVVFGDIGTSPLYALRTVLHESGAADRDTVYGVTSLVVWSLVVVVGLLHVGLLLAADNDGEGGILALAALLRSDGAGARTARTVSIVAMVGAALFLGDSVLTPAISVLAASEGLEVANPSLSHIVLPLALVVIAGVFVLQRVGSGRIGVVYGPTMLLWFLTLTAGGVGSLAQDPGVLAALSPVWAVRFLAADPLTGFLTLGAVVLVVTGAEALYTDLGHFGRRAISVGWWCVVFPALLVAYLGEASAVVRDPAAAADPFYAVVPSWATYPVLVLGTLATVIASEAVIAGAFTVLHQAGGLGLFPDLRTRHTSRRHAGQIYQPAANWGLAVAVLLVVLAFRSSARLASAYGVTVSATVVVTVGLYLVWERRRGGSPVRLSLAVVGAFVAAVFFAATLPKLLSGGWVPVVIALVVFVVMSTWWSGRQRLAAAMHAEETPASQLAGDRSALQTWAGDVVFLTHDCTVVPLALQALVDGAGALPTRSVLLSWEVADTPSASAYETDVRVHRFGDDDPAVIGLAVTLGYRERLDAGHLLAKAAEQEPDLLADLDPRRALYVVSEPLPRLARGNGMARWRQRLFLVLVRLSSDRVEQLSLPRDRSVVIGRELDL
jgi:KUP system potassium uptake protein